MTEELKLPILFDKCPNRDCGSTRRLVEIFIDQLKKVGQVPQEMPVALTMHPIPVLTSGLVTPEVPVIFTDACADCGTIYVVRVEKVKAQLGMKPPPGGPPLGPEFMKGA